MASLYPGVRLLLMVVGLCFGLKGTQAAGAGRAFPIDSENYIINEFKKINSILEWDGTNFLIDLSGQYVNCYLINLRHIVEVVEKTPKGNSIAKYVEYTSGPNSDVNAVNDYLTRVIDGWMKDGHLYGQIEKAKIFGCSVRPGCSGLVAVGCLFSPAASGNVPRTDQTTRNVPPTYQTTRNVPPTYQTTRNVPPTYQTTKSQPSSRPASQNALAFTPEQYDVAERLAGMNWDRSHFLENLSGFETNCDMIESAPWPFATAEAYLPKSRLHPLGGYDYEVNNKSTPAALEEILKRLKPVKGASRVGCSLIPDCWHNNKMYVVVSCLYE